jgi:hypothetical protein
MACTKTIQDSVTWVATILKQQPLNVSNWEPGLTFANLVLGRVLGPPMKWRFNRGNMNFGISTAGGTDYSAVVGDLGWIEKQWITDASGKIHALEGAEALAKTTNSYRPKTMAPVYDDNAGNITFRFDAIPTDNDTVFIDYQRKAPVASSFGSTWAPLPDEYGYIYNQLFLALAGNLVSDPRTPFWSQLGVSALLGAQTGLSAQAIAIFAGEWDRLMQTLSKSQDAVKAGMAGLTK